MACPNCHSEDFEMGKSDDGQGYWELEQYACNICGCEWQWEMKKTTKEGREADEEIAEITHLALLNL